MARLPRLRPRKQLLPNAKRQLMIDDPEFVALYETVRVAPPSIVVLDIGIEGKDFQSGGLPRSGDLIACRPDPPSRPSRLRPKRHNGTPLEHFPRFEMADRRDPRGIQLDEEGLVDRQPEIPCETSRQSLIGQAF